MIIHQVANSYGNYNYNAFVYTNQSWHSHFHKNYELIYTISGETSVFLNSEKVVMEKGDVLLISPYTIHSFHNNTESKIWVGVFDEAYVHTFAKKKGHIQYSKFRLEEKIKEFLELYLFYQGTPDLHMAKACLYAVCNECLKKAYAIEEKGTMTIKEKIIKYISENISNELTLEKAAETLGYEYHYFSSLFHNCFEINFKEFVNIFRIEHATVLLENNSLDIAYIAGECGYQSIRNFNRVFKKLTGKTPTEYRKAID